MAIIDVDGHIIEPEEMFADLPKEFYPRRPIPVYLPRDTARGDFNGCWIIEGQTFPSLSRQGHTVFYIPKDHRSINRDVSVAFFPPCFWPRWLRT